MKQMTGLEAINGGNCQRSFLNAAMHALSVGNRPGFDHLLRMASECGER